MAYIDTQKKLAEDLGVHPAVLSMFKKGRPEKRFAPLSEESAEALCKRLGVSMYELLSMSSGQLDRRLGELFETERSRKMRL